MLLQTSCLSLLLNNTRYELYEVWNIFKWTVFYDRNAHSTDTHKVINIKQCRLKSGIFYNAVEFNKQCMTIVNIFTTLPLSAKLQQRNKWNMSHNPLSLGVLFLRNGSIIVYTDEPKNYDHLPNNALSHLRAARNVQLALA